MIEYNPIEIKGIPTIGVPRIGIGRVPFLNVFGQLNREEYEIVETDEPYLLWENGSGMSWEDGENILLENQKQKIWLKARGLASSR